MHALHLGRITHQVKQVPFVGAREIDQLVRLRSHAEMLWHGVLAPDEQDLVRTLAVLERTREQVFPLRWETRLHPPDGPLFGELSGFAIWRDGAVAYG